MLAVVLSLGKHPGRLWLAVQLGVLGCVLLSLVTSCPWSFTPVGLVCVKLWHRSVACGRGPASLSTINTGHSSVSSLGFAKSVPPSLAPQHCNAALAKQQRTETFSLASLEPLTCRAVLSEGGETQRWSLSCVLLL